MASTNLYKTDDSFSFKMLIKQANYISKQVIESS